MKGKSGDIPVTWVVDDREALKAPGAVCWRSVEGKLYGLVFGCPCGCGYHYIPVVLGAVAGTAWGWNGDEKKPTLTPSLLNNDCGWHGYLIAGVFVPTSDRRE